MSSIESELEKRFRILKELIKYGEFEGFFSDGEIRNLMMLPPKELLDLMISLRNIGLKARSFRSEAEKIMY
jgi:hypothetical protein